MSKQSFHLAPMQRNRQFHSVLFNFHAVARSHPHTHTHVHKHACMHAHMHTQARTHTHAHVHKHACMQARTHTHTHTNTQRHMVHMGTHTLHTRAVDTRVLKSPTVVDSSCWSGALKQRLLCPHTLQIVQEDEPTPSTKGGISSSIGIPYTGYR